MDSPVSVEVGLDIVCAFFLMNPLATSASFGTDFGSPGEFESRLDILPKVSEAKKSSFEPNETCNDGRCRVVPSAGNNHSCNFSGSF